MHCNTVRQTVVVSGTKTSLTASPVAWMCARTVAYLGGGYMRTLLRSMLVFVAALSLALVVNPASGQVSKGSISGSVTDAQGGTVVGAAIKVVSRDTNQVETTETDNAGLFRVSLLPPGTYHVEISKEGFRKVLFDKVEVTVGADYGLGAVKLEVGEISATVEVSSAPPLIESTEAQITNSF